MIITVTVLLILLCGSIGLSQRALVGGSPIINFIFMLLLAAPTPYIIVGSLKSTMPVLYLILMGSSLVGFTRHYRTKSQETGKYLMDYDLVMITLPVAASGALFGALMKNLLSQLLLSAAAMILSIFLSCRAYKSLQYVKQAPCSDKPSLEEYLQHHEQLLDTNPMQLQQLDQIRGQFKYHESKRVEEQMNPQLQKILDEEYNRTPKNRIKIILFVLLYTLAILLTKRVSSEDLIIINPDINIPKEFSQEARSDSQLARTSGGSQIKGSLLDPYYDTYLDSQGLNNCAVGSFVFIIVHLILSYLSSKSVAIQIASRDAEKQKYGYVFLKQSQKMGSTKMWNCIIAGFFGGLVVGLFGIGASIVLVPTFVSSGVDEYSAQHSSGPSTFLSAMVSMSLSGMNGLYGPYSKAAITLILGVSVLSTIAMDAVGGREGDNLGRKRRSVISMWLFMSSGVLLLLYVALGFLAQMDHFTAFGYFC